MAGSQRAKERRRPARWLRWLVASCVVVLAVGLLAVGVSAFWVLTILPRSLPSVTAVESFDPSQGTKVYDDNDEPITEFHLERRIFVALPQIPKSLRDAVIATEDARFYSHHGVDPTGIARAIYQNFRRGRIVEGGSTITQQLAKVLFLTPDKSLERKLKEALLAGLPKAPATYSPFDHPDAAKRRRVTVLGRMVDTGVLGADQAKRAGAADLALVPAERRRTTSQYYLEYVQQLLEQEYGADIVYKGGLQVYTTLSPTMQLKAEQALRDGLKALETRRLKVSEKAGTAPATERPEG